MASIENLLRDVSMRGTKSDVEAFTATLEESAIAFATDTNEVGLYTNSAWVWVGLGSDPTAGYWEPAVVEDGEELFYMEDGDIAMVWVD